MNYPFWDVDIGYGILMAIIAVVHVFISHFAIGGGLYLVIAESAARKKNDLMKIEFLKKLSKFFVLVSVVFGALTGVGIWFIIGLLNPAATESCNVAKNLRTGGQIAESGSYLLSKDTAGAKRKISVNYGNLMSG